MKLKMAEFHLAACWYCSCCLIVTLSWLTGREGGCMNRSVPSLSATPVRFLLWKLNHVSHNSKHVLDLQSVVTLEKWQNKQCSHQLVFTLKNTYLTVGLEELKTNWAEWSSSINYTSLRFEYFIQHENWIQQVWLLPIFHLKQKHTDGRKKQDKAQNRAMSILTCTSSLTIIL